MKKECGSPFLSISLRAFITLLFIASLIGCVRPNPAKSRVVSPSTSENALEVEANSPAENNQANTENPVPSPLPQSPSLETNSDEFFILHTVVSGDTLSLVARQYETSTEELIILNQIEDVNLIYEGQVLRVPGPKFEKLISPDFQIIPDNELVYGPSTKGFTIVDYVEPLNGYLMNYEEEVEGHQLNGPEIVQIVADRHSVNPKLLLAALEYQSGWLTQKNPQEKRIPLGYSSNEDVEGLYKQLSWAANLLNWGYYGRSEGGMKSLVIADEIPIIFAESLSNGTAGVQLFMAARDNISYESWLHDVGPEGFLKTYQDLFGDPFQNDVEPLVPDNLVQPTFELPWAAGETWYFTGGPHGGWNTGSAWAALDFVPSDALGGCSPTESWVRAMADGVVTRSGNGAVVTDLDDDHYAGTGWAITYMHLEDRDRVLVGTEVKTGDPLGHPGCVGGFTNGTHVHIARLYNGRWIAADGSLPFEMGGWISEGAGSEYNGWLIRDDMTKTADVLHSEDNAITAD